MKSSRLPESDQVAKYFHDHASDFDAIYEDEKKSPIRRWRDRLSRGTVVRRVDLVDELSSKLEQPRILDVGCGAARFAVRLAGRSSEFVGLDFAPEMITLARKKAEEAGVADKCTFLQVDFLEWDAGKPFDLAIAIGVFDYVSKPGPLLAKLAEVSGGKVIGSFPRKFHVLVPLRLVRLKMANCPVFFYTRQQVEELGRANLKKFRVQKFGRDYILVGDL